MNIGIIGLGLIGGSLGLDFRSQGHKVWGVSRQLSTCDIAVQKGVVDESSTNLELLATVDLIFICTPIHLIVPTLEKLTPYLKTEAIVTDVGSVKGAIVDNCSQLWPNFVGSHPMAGKTEQGINAAQLGLFVDAPYLITPLESTPNFAVQILTEIVRRLGCKIYYSSPEEHDRAVAWISHLPVMISTSLIQACGKEKDLKIRQLAENLASSGFRDTSRVGAGNSELGLMMAKYNRQALLISLTNYRQNLDQVIDYIAGEKWQELEETLLSSHQYRANFIQSK
ncbi:MAG: prephenate/arogenate dehydrogenase [Microcystis aeruginosa BS13-02]|uniref:Prephenate/arogenate dehydrogenase n=1 Tax=Microcystis aeruginosa Ma_MB_S_20031200_S102 TaxID=2486254 RepID=A0A552EN37_MICAE|nr:prephenate/arogenate dehydrogenase [Microcystis aeruginosa]MDB9507577.1 prephenate/arogenate dehydrogenase [Microcystis aeruginosa CS-338/01]NCS26304.1 prephenate/arogenate dehydrogenase [Microcystis aeruginosa BS13-02]TRU22643.1 MAG: prephenate/arogenate dehydrogenase [Microcystis aeruginosa Ma_MB_S_20031200_S102D]TRU35879.1 MAG: prephenate/arogenate dehydrogenase [Microcystis aeruginosa Ma_MB_S_20031200_S102]